jgi:hypothetical protein
MHFRSRLATIRELAIAKGVTAMPEDPTVVVRSLEREGRIRSAERTEVHLATYNAFSRTDFLPVSMRTSGIRKEVRHAGKKPPVES